MCYSDSFSHQDAVTIGFGRGGTKANIIHILIEPENFTIETQNLNSRIHSPKFFLNFKKSAITSGNIVNKTMVTLHG